MRFWVKFNNSLSACHSEEEPKEQLSDIYFSASEAIMEENISLNIEKKYIAIDLSKLEVELIIRVVHYLQMLLQYSI